MMRKRTGENFALGSVFQKIISQKIVLILALAVFAVGSIIPLAYASDHQNGLDAVTDIEFRTATDFHTYLPGSELSFNVECNQLAGEFAIGFNTFIQKSDGSPADVNDVRNLVFLQRGSSDSGALIDAVNTGHNILKLTAEVTCAKLLPVSLPTVPDAPTELSVVTGDQQAILTWTAPLFDGDSPIIKYQVSAMPDPHTYSADDVFVETAFTSFTFDGLVNGITYKFQATAVNDVGPGISSEIITGTPYSISLPPITTTTYPTSDPTGKTVLCHNDKVTLSLPTQAVRAHLVNHDDYLGECSDHTSAPNEVSKRVVKQQDREADKQQREADRLAKQAAKQLQLESEKAQKNADRLAKLEADKQQREADRLAQQEAKKLQLEAEKAQRQADQIAKLEADKQQRESEKAERESILEVKKVQNNSEKSDKESKLPPLGPK